MRSHPRFMSPAERELWRVWHYHRKRDGILRVAIPSQSDRYLAWWEVVWFYFGGCP